MKKILKIALTSSMLFSSLVGLGESLLLANAQTATEVDAKDEQDDAEKTEEVEASQAQEAKESEDDQADDQEAEESEDDQADNQEETINWSQIENDLKETMKAKGIEQLYQSSKAKEFEENDLVSRLDGYSLYQVTDFNRDFKTQFKQTDEGLVLVMKIHLENNSDETVYFNNTPEVNASDPYIVIAETDALISSTGEYEGYFPLTEQKMEPGEQVEGILTYYFAPEAAELALADGTVFVEFYGFRDQEDFSGATQLLNPEFLLPLSEDKEETASASGDQYPDTIVSDNYGTKEVIEQEDTEASQEEEDLVVSVSGYEVSKIIPNEATKESFADYPNGIISINVKMDVQNNSEDLTVDLSGIYASLVLGEQVEVKNNNYLQVDPDMAEVAPGEMGTVYRVFTIDGDLWEKYKEDSLMIVPSIKDTEYQDMHDYQAIVLEFKK